MEPLYVLIATTLFAYLFGGSAWMNRGMRLFDARTRGWLASLTLAWLGAVAFLYVLSPSFIDHVEPAVATLSISLARGEPIYTPLDDAKRVSLLYGPTTYFVGALLSRWIADAILAAKLTGTIQGLGTLLVVGVCLVKSFGRRWALEGLGVLAAVMLVFGHQAYWNRGDSLLLLGAGMCASASICRNRAAAVLLAALGAGLVVGAKAHGILYLVPCVPLFIGLHGWRPLLLSGVLALLWLGASLGQLDSISLENYWQWLQAAMAHGVSFNRLSDSLSHAVLLGLPLFLASRRSTRWSLSEIRTSPALQGIALLFACLLTTVLISSKEGAGRHHLLPLAPAALILACVMLKRTPVRGNLHRDNARVKRIMTALLVGLVVATGSQIAKHQSRVIAHLVDEEHSSRRSELEALISRYPSGSIAMGYGSSEGYSATFLRPLLAGHSSFQFLDAPALMDMQAAGIPLPTSTIDRMRSGPYDYYVVPAAGNPFSMGTFYEGCVTVNGEQVPTGSGVTLFTSELQQAFSERYVEVEATANFAIYRSMGEGR